MGEFIAFLAFLATAVGVVVAYQQLSNLNTTLRLNSLGIVLQLESEMNSRKERVDELAAAVRIEVLKQVPNEDLVDVLSDQLDGSFENWLNACDRLAYCILRGYFAERDWKSEYRSYFLSLVQDHPEYFGRETIYTNIVDIHHKWMRD